MNKYVLDSSALLAVIYNEGGSEIVESILHQCVVSTVNVSEAASVMVLAGSDAKQSVADIMEMVPHVISFDADIALITARMRSETKALGLSLGDRACLATAEHLNAEAVTADKVWGKLKSPMKIKVIR